MKFYKEVPIITFADRFFLFFKKEQYCWDHEESTVTAFKVMNGVTYILRQEPMAYGDPRMQQISRFE